MKLIVDLSGFVYSGKSAVSDILREVEGLSVPASEEEFDLLRIPGGLIDLKHAVLDWSPSRSNSAFHRFERVARIAGRSLPFHRKFFADGMGYEARYPGYFGALERFLRDIVLLRWDTPWPYDNVMDNPWQILLRKVAGRFGVIKLRDLCLIDAENFLQRAREFTNGVLWSGVDQSRFHTVVVHNSLEAFDPARNLDLYGNAKAIVVDRDPRDIYATALVIAPGQPDRLNRYLHICAGHDIDLFIKRFNLYRSSIRESPNVLRIRFEDVVLDSERSVQSILGFIGVETPLQVSRLRHFRPEASRKNVGMWKEERFRKHWKDFELIGGMCNAP